jgi:hypothetical protein
MITTTLAILPIHIEVMQAISQSTNVEDQRTYVKKRKICHLAFYANTQNGERLAESPQKNNKIKSEKTEIREA